MNKNKQQKQPQSQNNSAPTNNQKQSNAQNSVADPAEMKKK